jgi:hypothetical protein
MAVVLLGARGVEAFHGDSFRFGLVGTGRE